MRDLKWKFTICIIGCGLLCIIVLVGVMTLYWHYAHMPAGVKQERWVEKFKSKVFFLECCFGVEFIAAGFALQYIAKFNLYIVAETETLLWHFITLVVSLGALACVCFFWWCHRSFKNARAELERGELTDTETMVLDLWRGSADQKKLKKDVRKTLYRDIKNKAEVTLKYR